MRIAVFDIDGTLVRGSTERAFAWYLLRRRILGAPQLFAFLLFMIRYLPTGGIETPRKNKAYLTGLRMDDIDRLAREFVDEILAERLFAPAIQRLKRHRLRGDTVVLVSGTLLPIARALADKLGANHACATLVSQRNGVILAQPPEVHPYDAAKLTLVRQIAAEFGIGMQEVTAYGDSGHDLYLLSKVGEPVAVQPDRTLLAAAIKHEWEILAEPPVEDVLRS